VSTSGGLLHREASWAMVFYFASKIVEERRRVVHVASSRRLCRSEVKDGRFDDIRCGVVEVGSNYPLLVIIFLLAHRGILVFWFLLQIDS
jgi:hypothetical protein